MENEVTGVQKRVFTEADLDNCWIHYKSYLIDILNGDYDLTDARNDLESLIDSEFDKRIETKIDVDKIF